jgi:hypothetical protein
MDAAAALCTWLAWWLLTGLFACVCVCVRTLIRVFMRRHNFAAYIAFLRFTIVGKISTKKSWGCLADHLNNHLTKSLCTLMWLPIIILALASDGTGTSRQIVTSIFMFWALVFVGMGQRNGWILWRHLRKMDSRRSLDSLSTSPSDGNAVYLRLYLCICVCAFICVCHCVYYMSV